MPALRLAMAQINPTVGGFDTNITKILRAIDEARSQGADLITFPELAICGYPPEDLLFRLRFIEENRKMLNKVVEASKGLTIIIGFVDSRKDLYNAAAVIHDGKLVDVYHKICLPNYGVFDESRYFKPGKRNPLYRIGDITMGVNICEDIWCRESPVIKQAKGGADIIINISASPYHYGKCDDRREVLRKHATRGNVIMVYNNLVGGQDELVFDGNSMVLDKRGETIVEGEKFKEELVLVDLDIAKTKGSRPQRVIEITGSLVQKEKPPLPERKIEEHLLVSEVYDALVLGTRDYILKNKFEKAVVGISGGIDSSLVATIAVDALGASNVTGVIMPSGYSSQGSIRDAGALSANLGIKVLKVPIEKMFEEYQRALEGVFKGTKKDITEENIQARIRGNILMALSNKFGWLVLATGNKSEMATGYTTLYGDLAGGFAVIKDVPKTMVYELTYYRNSLENTPLIPEAIVKKAPSAELKPGQKDRDSLPPYEVLDPILQAYVEEDKSIKQMVDMGFDEETVKQVVRLVESSEYKRRQSPPGIKITPKAFGRDRRMPITNDFRI